MGGLLQKLLLKMLPEAASSTADSSSSSSAERKHMTAALGCCSTIRIDDHVDENAYYDKEDAAEEGDSSDMG